MRGETRNLAFLCDAAAAGWTLQDICSRRILNIPGHCLQGTPGILALRVPGQASPRPGASSDAPPPKVDSCPQAPLADAE